MGVEVDSGDGSALYSDLHERKSLKFDLSLFSPLNEIAFNFKKKSL